jgi:AbrB family looped-hinge helix DNA binding protein
MPTATVTSKGQVTIPRKVREALRLRPGDRVDFVLGEEGGCGCGRGRSTSASFGGSSTVPGAAR